MKCFFLDHGLTVRPDGRVAPCCQWHVPSNFESRYLTDDYESYFQQKKEEFGKGWIPECHECQKQEKMGGMSDRIDWKDGHKDYNISGSGRKHWDLKLHNTCNLTCRMCSAGDSSSWQKIIKENPDEEWNSWVKVGEKKFGWRDKIPNLLEKHIDDLELLKFTGGEPFMIPQVKEVLKKVIAKGKAGNVDVKITTNATFSLTDDWIDILKQFKSVFFSLSINGIKSRYEYIRQNAKWETTYKNVMSIQELGFIRQSVNEIYQMLVFDMVDEINKFWKSNDLGCNWAYLTTPSYHSLNSLPNYLLKKYNHNPQYKFDQKLHNEFIKQTAIHDRIYLSLIHI